MITSVWSRIGFSVQDPCWLDLCNNALFYFSASILIVGGRSDDRVDFDLSSRLKCEVVPYSRHRLG
jgi:hypothetical protein